MSSLSGDDLTKSAQIYPPKGQPAVVPPVHSGYHPPHQGYSQPYPGYPYPSQHYPPSRLSSNTAYYASSQLPYLFPEQKKGYTFAQIVLTMMIVLIIGATIMSVLMWYNYGSDIPRFRLSSFSVPSFILSNSSLAAIWEVNVTMKRPNHKLVVNFDTIETSLVYRDTLLDTSFVHPLQLKEDDSGTLRITFEVPSNDHQNSTGAFWLKRIGEDRKKGSIVFDLKMDMRATFTSDHLWPRRTALKIDCWGIKVDFSAPTGGGTCNSTKQDCTLI